MESLLYVGVGGFFGANVRYLLTARLEPGTCALAWRVPLWHFDCQRLGFFRIGPFRRLVWRA